MGETSTSRSIPAPSSRPSTSLVKGDVAGGGPVLVRMHATNVLTDLLGVAGHERSMVQLAMRQIAAEGRGVVVLIRDPHLDAVSSKLERRRSEGGAAQSGEKLVEYGIGAQILLDLGVREMVLLSNSPTRKVVGLEGYGLQIVDQRRLEYLE